MGRPAEACKWCSLDGVEGCNKLKRCSCGDKGQRRISSPFGVSGPGDLFQKGGWFSASIRGNENLGQGAAAGDLYGWFCGRDEEGLSPG